MRTFLYKVEVMETRTGRKEGKGRKRIGYGRHAKAGESSHSNKEGHELDDVR